MTETAQRGEFSREKDGQIDTGVYNYKYVHEPVSAMG